MRIIISPAKKMRVDTDSFPCEGLPVFLPKAEELLAIMRKMSYEELKQLWKCNDQIAGVNAERVTSMDLRQNLTPAILAYVGIQYQYMAPGVFTRPALEFIQDHLRILSGFYGMLRPFDGVVPYRLEMQAKLKSQNRRDLYQFWGSAIADRLVQETDCILNLASKEYSQCVSSYLPKHIRFITCVFGEQKGNKILEKGTLCKMARGEMVRYLAENQRTQPESAKEFDRLGYRFVQELSSDQTYVFLKEGT